MKFSNIIILKEHRSQPVSRADTITISVNALGDWFRSGKIIKHLFRYNSATLYTNNWDMASKPLLITLALHSLTLGICRIEEENGRVTPVSIPFFYLLFINFIKDYLKKSRYLRQKQEEIDTLPQLNSKSTASFNSNAQPAYLRFDLFHDLKAGGSVSHTTGVLNNLRHFTPAPIYLTSLSIPGVDTDIATHILQPKQRFLDFIELPFLYSNDKFIEKSEVILQSKPLSFFYQRYSIYNYTGVRLAQNRKIPLVLEYNGSEIWVYKNWSKALKYETLAEKIELLNLNAADVVVVVSQPLKDDLVNRGVNSDKILVDPNGVDPEIYSPEIDGSDIRRKHHLKNKTVIGFIGTFGKWHGAEVLAHAFGLLIQKHPQYRDNTRLLMIGDGHTMPQVQQELESYGVTRECILTGIVSQEEGPAHLAACDLLASPHVPNPDGTPFFGSPTKLFEYMAMGKGIIASDLEQIGEVLEHNGTAWMVKPGDAESLMLALKTLIDNPEICKRLGEAARREVVAKYTWKEHTRKIIEKLKERCPCD
jgi:glycosyltransferase involved in cell wall biosynthesis